MTCIVALKKDGKVWIGGDRRVSYGGPNITPPTKPPEDLPFPKIIQKDGFAFGFSGNRGIQDLFEWSVGSFDFSQKKFDDLISQVQNVISLLQTTGSILVCNKQQIGVVIKNDNGLFRYPAIRHSGLGLEFNVAGVGLEAVTGSLYSSREVQPDRLIRQAIGAVAMMYPNVVGGDIDVYQL